MHVYRAQSTTPELTRIHQRHQFLVRQDREPVETLEEGQHAVALLDRPERKFLYHAAMTSDLVVSQERNE